MRRVLVAVLVALGMVVSGCGLKLSDQISLPSEITGRDPQTLDAATAAAQEVADRNSAKDFAGVWLMLTKQNRDGISQADYTTLASACDQGGLPAKVTGVRMEGTNKAIVRWNVDLPVLSGFKVTKTMFYEDGKWALAPEPQFVPELGKPVQQIIADLRAQGHCDSKAPQPTSTISSSPTSEPQPPVYNDPNASCSVNVVGCDGYDECHPVVTGKTDCFPDNESCSKPGNNFPWCSTPLPACPTPGPGDEPQQGPPCAPDRAAPSPTSSEAPLPASPQNGGPCDDYDAYVDAEPAWVVCDNTHHWHSTVYPKPTGWGSAVGSAPCNLPIGATVSNDGRMIVCEHSTWVLADN